MKSKTINSLIIIFLILVAVFGAARWFANNESSDLPGLDLSDIDNKIDKIEIAVGDDELIFLKNGSSWSHNKRKAGKEFGDFLKRLKDLKIKEVVSRNESNYLNFGVEEKPGKHLRFFSGDELTHHLIFGNASELVGMYMRIENDKNVYKVSDDLTYFFGKQSKDWAK